MKFINTEVWGFEHALRGMRNPMNSWDKSDSGYCSGEYCGRCADKEYCANYYHDSNPLHKDQYIIGENDMALAQKLIRAGSEHRKFMRQIFVSVDITAPLYWWKEFDTYKVGTVVNSASTMHKLATTPITLDCFETDDYDGALQIETRQSTALDMLGMKYEITVAATFGILVKRLELLRQKYLETKDKRYWKELIRWLPESWLQTRMGTMSYENILNMVRQRKNHKLNEWSGVDNPDVPNFISWARTLPYAQELIFIDETKENK